jgi:glutamine amidotransferase
MKSSNKGYIMCIIASKPEGFTLDQETITNMWDNNPDGAGFMYAKGEQLIIVKGLMTLEDFKQAYQRVGELPAVLHFRIKTHGKKNEVNTHPFRISNKLAFAHNGIISNIHCSDKDKSDTWHFNETILKPMVQHDGGFFRKPYNIELLKGFIGWSKLAFMDNKGKMYFINEDKGEWQDGVWFSNTSYRAKKQKSKEVVPFVGDYYHHQPYKSNYRQYGQFNFVEGDIVEVVSTNKNSSSIHVGDIGVVDNLLNNGWMRVVFHIPQDTGTVLEISCVLHEDNLRFNKLQGAAHA